MSTHRDTNHDGVHVGKSVFPDAEPLPTIVIDITNERAEEVVVHVADDPPADTPPDDVGFGPSELDRWRVHDDGVVRYRRAVAPGRSVVTTYYRKSADAAEDPAPPRVLSVEPVGDRDHPPTIGDGGSAGTLDARTVTSRPDEGRPGRARPTGTDGTDRDGDPPDGSVQRGQLIPDGGRFEGSPGEGDPQADTPRGDGADDDGSEPPPWNTDADDPPADVFDSAFDDEEPGDAFLSELTAAQPISWGEVARTLAEELRHGRVDDDVQADLRAALGGAEQDAAGAQQHAGDASTEGPSSTGSDAHGDPAEAGTSPQGNAAPDDAADLGTEELPARVEVRLDRLDAKTERMAAYTDAIEEFLTDKGTGRQALDTLDDRVSALEDATEARAERLSELEAAVGSLADDLGALKDIAGDVEDLDVRLESADDTIALLRERLEALEQGAAGADDLADSEAVEALASDVSELSETVQALQSVADQVDDLADLPERVDDVAESVARLDDLEDTVEGNEAAIAEVRESVDRITGLLDALSDATREDWSDSAEQSGDDDPDPAD